jgi:hypothetical protein
VGDTVILELVLITAPMPQLLAYHWYVVPGSTTPPVALRVVLSPRQMVLLPDIAAGAVKLPFTVNDSDMQVVVLQVPLRLTK